MDDDDDVPTLSAETFAALQEFYTEQQKRQEILDKLEADNKLQENVLFDENWQLSQFWYDEITVHSLVTVIDKTVADGGRVALISCPTLFVPVKRKIGDRATAYWSVHFGERSSKEIIIIINGHGLIKISLKDIGKAFN